MSVENILANSLLFIHAARQAGRGWEVGKEKL
jgi:hypothetical protein